MSAAPKAVHEFQSVGDAGVDLVVEDTTAPVTVLAPLHVGCYQLFAREGIQRITELKGGTVGLQASPPNLVKLMAAQVGLDPATDIHWITNFVGTEIAVVDGFWQCQVRYRASIFR